MKHIFLTGIIALASLAAAACDVCGCNAVGASTSLLPQLNSSVIGVRYSYRKFDSEHPSNFENGGTKTKENFHTVDISGRYVATSRFHLSARIPFHYMTQTIEGQTSKVAGIGDISIMGQFLAINPEFCSGKTAKHQFRIGAGLKFPTGSIKTKFNNEMLPITMQAGTGSLDILTSGIYTLRYKDWGLNAELGYRINTTNSDRYKFGNRISSTVSALYWLKLSENVTLLPTIGASMDWADENKQSGVWVRYTGGALVTGVVGADLMVKRVVLSARYNPIIWQQLSENYVKARTMVDAGIYISLGK